MEIGSKIANVGEGDFLRWNPALELPTWRHNEVRFSLGFLRSAPASWFQRFNTHWLTLFQSIGIDVTVREVLVNLDFPEGLDRVTPIEIDGEVSVIGMDRQSQQAIASGIAPGCKETAVDITIEYIERRLATIFSDCWAGSLPLSCKYLSTASTEAVEIVGNVKVVVDIGEFSAEVWFGLGPRLLERLDLFWRGKLLEKRLEANVNDTALHMISVQLAQLHIRPALLIDYIRPGTVISLAVPVCREVVLRLNGAQWAAGKLGQFNGKFAVEISSLDAPPPTQVPQTTGVEIEIASTELDHEALIEHSQIGAVMLTGTPLTSNAALVINGENVSAAVVGQIAGQFALNVLPK